MSKEGSEREVSILLFFLYMPFHFPVGKSNFSVAWST